MAEQGRTPGWSMASVAPPPPPRNEGFEVLSRQECLRLLAQGGPGRVAVSVGALPTILPVHFALVGEDVVFPAVPGGELDRAVRDAVVAFEADRIDPVAGWSVVVTGLASVVRDVETLRHLRPLPAPPWAPDEERCFLRVPAEVVSGRRILSRPLHVSGSVLAPSATSRTPDSDAGAEVIRDGLDGARLEPIPAEECLRLLATEEVGRPGRRALRAAPSLPAALPVRPWAAGDRLHYVRIVPVSITGARIPPATTALAAG